MTIDACILCRGTAADAELDRVEVWRDGQWRLTVSLSSEIAGFAYLEPLRHIRYLHELDGEEAASFGTVLARCMRMLKEATAAEIVYVYVFGDGVPHLHLHLAPHRQGDALNEQMIRGEIAEEKLANGMTRFQSAEFPALPRDHLQATADRIRTLLAGS